MIRERPSQIAKFHAGLILRSALNEGWEAPAEYSPLKRARIQRELKKLADKLAATGPNAPAEAPAPAGRLGPVVGQGMEDK